MPIRVKICGITTIEDARVAAEAGADLIGLNFFKRSPRVIDVPTARAICHAINTEFGDRAPRLVGVFVNEIVGRISITMGDVGFKAAQLSGSESVEMLRELRGTAFKAIRPVTAAEAAEDETYFSPAAPTDESLPTILLDGHKAGMFGGTGEKADDGIAALIAERSPRWMLAGGLTPDNVADAVRRLHPWGVDVAGGVEGETAGRKDAGKIRAFIQAARGVI